MRIRCPSCSAAYEVSDSLLERPRMVRCARCDHDWMAEPVSDESALVTAETAETAVEATGEPEPAETGSATESIAIDDTTAETAVAEMVERPVVTVIPPLAPPKRDRWLTAAWAASFAALALLGAASYVRRDVMMREWPASRLVFEKFGLASGASTTAEVRDTGSRSTR